MKKVKLTKIISSLLIAVSVLALNPTGANAEWKQNSSGWWNTEGDSYSVGWKQIDEKWYYFLRNGYMAHDTIVDGYKLGSDGSWIQNTQNNLSSSSTDAKDVANNDCTFNSDQFISILETKFSNIQIKDLNDKGPFLSTTARKEITIGNEYMYINIYNNNKDMEKDALNVPNDGCGTAEYLSEVRYYKKGNIIVLYIGENESTISILKSILGEQFAGDK